MPPQMSKPPKRSQPMTTLTVPPSLSHQTIAAALRKLFMTSPPLSWSAARKLLSARRVTVNSTLCVDEARRLKTGDVICVTDNPQKPPPQPTDVRIVYADDHLVVVDKPAGVQTLRRHEELHWDTGRKSKQPTLDELVPRALGEPDLRVHPVHRLDRDTSGLMLFALTEPARVALIRMFKKHQVRRTYLAVVHGIIDQQRTIETMFIRDRGDGLRGSGRGPDAKRAITHVAPVRTIHDRYTIVDCALETGRTHQIRIHLSEIGHMLCGERVYVRSAPKADSIIDQRGAPRQALHSVKLDFQHPISQRQMHFASDVPRDLSQWLKRLGCA